jgi:hypothetical protein
MNFLKYQNTILKNSILLAFVTFVFLWDIKYYFFEARFIIILLVIPFLFDYKNYFKNINKTQIYFFSIIFFILLHLIIISKLNRINIDHQRIYEIIFLYYFFIISFNYKKNIINNLNNLIYIFLLIFFPTILLCQLVNPIKIQNIMSCYPGWFATHKILFLENSHFGMISSSIIWYSILTFFQIKRSINYKLLIIFFIIFSFINVSTSFLFGFILTSIIVIILFFKNLNYKELFFIIFLLFTASAILIFNKECFSRVNDTFKILNIKIFKNHIDKDQINNKDQINKSEKFTPNMSTGVYVNSFKVVLFSLKNNIFGYGINQNNEAFKKYFEAYTKENKIDSAIDFHHPNYQPDYLYKLNFKDASNTLAKLLNEFGLFTIFILYFLSKFLFNNNINLALKFFLISPLISQLFFRGAGYFNGGFIFFLFFAIILSFKKKYEKF